MAEQTISIPRVRQESDVLLHVALKDNGVAVDWTSLSDVKAYLFSDAQRVIAGRCEAEVDGSDSEQLNVTYAAVKPQYLGQNSLLIRCTYQGRQKSFDVPCLVFVERTAQATGVTVLTDPELAVELEVEDVSTSLLDGAIAAALDAAADADDAAQAAETAAAAADAAAQHGPVIGENGDWWLWDFETGAYVDTGVAAGGSGAANAVQYVPQSLTAAQKAQARINVGLRVLWLIQPLQAATYTQEGFATIFCSIADLKKAMDGGYDFAMAAGTGYAVAKDSTITIGFPRTVRFYGDGYAWSVSASVVDNEIVGDITVTGSAILNTGQQGLTSGEKSQVLTNIGAYAKPGSGIPKSDLASGVQTSLGKADGAVLFGSSQGLTGAQKLRARYNINAAENFILESSITEMPEDFTTTDIEVVDEKLGVNGAILALMNKCGYFKLSQDVSIAPVYIYNVLVRQTSQSSYAFDFQCGEDLYRLTYVSENDTNTFTFTKHKVELQSNKVTSLSNQSTDTQYPSAKCVYDALATKQATIDSSHKLPYSLVSGTPTVPAYLTVSDITQLTSAQVAALKIGDIVIAEDTQKQIYVVCALEDEANLWLATTTGQVIGIVNYEYVSSAWSYYGTETYTIPPLSTSVSADKTSNTKASTPKSVYDEVHPTVGSAQPAGGMLPNVFYNLGTLSGDTTFAFASASDNTIENEWMFQFTTPSTAPTITWPQAITAWLGGNAPTINASKTYQVSVINGLGVIAEF